MPSEVPADQAASIAPGVRTTCEEVDEVPEVGDDDAIGGPSRRTGLGGEPREVERGAHGWHRHEDDPSVRILERERVPRELHADALFDERHLGAGVLVLREAEAEQPVPDEPGGRPAERDDVAGRPAHDVGRVRAFPRTGGTGCVEADGLERTGVLHAQAAPGQQRVRRSAAKREFGRSRWSRSSPFTLKTSACVEGAWAPSSERPASVSNSM